jgi:lycopene beta-cyclase
VAGPQVDVDLVIVGDGPGGLALAAACRRRGLDVAVVGTGRPWTATYASWLDDVADVADLPSACFATLAPAVVVHALARHELARPYGVLDGDALRRHLAADLDARVDTVEGAQHFAWGTRVLTSGGRIDARLVVDAAGRGGPEWGSDRPTPAAWQTAHGIVVADPPARFDRDLPTFMDLRTVPGTAERSTFCYVVPVADGWLVEETVLAARRAVDPAWLAARLAERLGPDGPRIVAGARRTEVVAIPLGGRLPSDRQPIVPFGAAAGYTNPVSGFSVAAALRAAPRVADALAEILSSPGRPDGRAVHRAVWRRSMRRTRRLHDHGLQVLLRLPPNDVVEFFDAFFTLPIDVWSAYLRIDSSPREVSRAMAAVLRRLPWRVRRRVLTTPPWPRWPADSAPSA